MINLWFFLTISTIFGIAFLITIVIVGNKRKMKELEVEALKVKNANIKAEVEDAVARQLKDQTSRIEILEAIVTDKQYQLNEKITNLR